VSGFLCDSHAEGARYITAFGGWRAWRPSLIDRIDISGATRNRVPLNAQKLVHIFGHMRRL
jgi:hypothetical protein